MRILFFILGTLFGVVMAILFVMTLPIYWDEHRSNLEKTLGKPKGHITITVAWNPDMKHINSSMGMICADVNKSADQGRWDEFKMKVYQSKEDAIQARNKILKALP